MERRMKLSGLTMIAIAAGSLFAAAPAAAQRQVEVHRTVTTTRTVNGGDWHDNRRYERRHHRRKVCTKRWVNHHRVTRCRWR
jgi:hypothetical protein